MKRIHIGLGLSAMELLRALGEWEFLGAVTPTSRLHRFDQPVVR
ncbi:MAG: hypothetical protein K0S58_2369 [Nitrospira sp.]|jgi:hypothetical protein|nr:hypothetical protein [Nitrospira sp.]